MEVLQSFVRAEIRCSTERYSVEKMTVGGGKETLACRGAAPERCYIVAEVVDDVINQLLGEKT